MAYTIEELVFAINGDISGLERAMKESSEKFYGLTKAGKDVSRELQRDLKAFIDKANADVRSLEQTTKLSGAAIVASAEKGINSLSTKINTLYGLLSSGVGLAAFNDVMKSAGEAERATLRLTTIFGESADAARDLAQSLATTYGTSTTEIEKEIGFVSNLLTSLGVGKKTALEMSETLVKLGADLYATTGEADSLSDAVHTLAKSLIGTEGARALKDFGIGITKTDLKAFANNTDSASSALARYQVILQRTLGVQGKFSEYTDTYNVAIMQYKAAVEDLKITLGEGLLPVVVDVLQKTASLLHIISDSTGWSVVFSTVLKSTVALKIFNATLLPLVGTVTKLFELSGEAKLATDAYKLAMDRLSRATTDVGEAQTILANAMNSKIGTTAAIGAAKKAVKEYSDAQRGAVAATREYTAATNALSTAKMNFAIGAAVVVVSATAGIIQKWKEARKAARDLKGEVEKLTADIIENQKYTALQQAEEINRTYEKQEKAILKYAKTIQGWERTIASIREDEYKSAEDKAKEIAELRELERVDFVKMEELQENQRQAILKLADTYRHASESGKKSIEAWFPRLIEKVKEAGVELEELEESGVDVEQMLEDLNAELPTLPTNLEKVTDQIVKLRNELNNLPDVTVETIGLDFSNLDKKYDEHRKQLREYRQRLLDSLKTDTPKNKELTDNFLTAISKELTPIIENEKLSYDERIKAAKGFVENYKYLLMTQGLDPEEFKSYYESLLNVDKWYADQRELVLLQNQNALKDAYEGFFEQTAESQLAANLRRIDYYKEADKYLAKVLIKDEEALQKTLAEIDERWAKARAQVITSAYDAETESYMDRAAALRKSTEELRQSVRELSIEFNTGIGFLDIIGNIPNTFTEIEAKFDEFVDDIAAKFIELYDNIVPDASPEVVRELMVRVSQAFAKFKETGDAGDILGLQDLFKQAIDTIKDPELKAEATENMEALFDSIDQVSKDRTLQIVNTIGQTVTQIFTSLAESLGNLLQTISDNYIGVLQAQLADMQTKYDDLKELMDSRNDEMYEGMTVKQKDAILRQKKLDEEELARQKEQMEAQEELIEEAERKAWERQKAINLATAYMNGNMAVLNAFTATLNNQALSDYALPIAIMNAATAKLYSYAQIAAIAAQQYPSYAVGAYDLPQDQMAQVHKGEMIIPRPFATEIRENGGFGGGDVVVNVYGTKDDVEVEASEGEKYKQIDIYVTKKVKGLVATGQLDNVLQQRFAVGRVGRRG